MGLEKTIFPGINRAASHPIELCAFQHAVKIIVNEKGTEGGAASLGEFTYTSAYYPTEIPIVPISFDRPFIYMIRDTISGTILFMGAITTL